MEPASTGRISLVAWCLLNNVSELIVFDIPADMTQRFIAEKVAWINVGRRAMRQPELKIRFYG